MSRTLRGEIRTFLPLALTSIFKSLPPRPGRGPDLRRSVRTAAGLAAEGPRRGELAQTVADHVLRDEDWDMAAAVVDGDRQADHLRHDRRRARPGADHRA